MGKPTSRSVAGVDGNGTGECRVDPRVVRTRQAVVSAAADLLASEGIGRLTIDAIAQKSGVARSTIYRNWPDRADLILAAFESVARMECPLTALGCPGGHPIDGGCGARSATTVAELRRVMGQHGRRMVAMRDSVVGAAMASIVAEARHDPAIAQALHRFGAHRRKPLIAAAESVVQAVRSDSTGVGTGGGAPDTESVAGPLAVDHAMERFIAPFFFRLLVSGEPPDDALLDRQVTMLIGDLGLNDVLS